MVGLFARLSRARKKFRRLRQLDRAVDDLKVLQGRMFGVLNRERNSGSLRDYEFRVFSQWGEDGIVQKLVDCLEIPNKTFIEFGVEDFTEANCRFLMVNNLWKGYVIDGSEENVEKIASAPDFWRYQLSARAAFISRENINELLSESGFAHDLGILSVDVDGVDYWVFEAIKDYKARVLIMEYNAVFGCDRPITVPYDPAFFRTRAHHSNLYFGASLPALTLLANSRGYALIGTNLAACNAFFVREDLVQQTPFLPLTAQEAFLDSTARESRNAKGELTYVSGASRLELIRGLPVLNVATNQIEPL
jgi:hypothetical protein